MTGDAWVLVAPVAMLSGFACGSWAGHVAFWWWQDRRDRAARRQREIVVTVSGDSMTTAEMNRAIRANLLDSKRAID
jgi:hypothetical protein